MIKINLLNEVTYINIFSQVQEIVRAIINLYEMWKSYDEKKEIQALLGKMPKPKPAPQR